MIIGIDARIAQAKMAGMGYYLKNLLKGLLEIDQENQYKVLGDKILPPMKNLKMYGLRGRKKKIINFLWKTTSWPRFEKMIKGTDLGFFPNFVMPPTRLAKTVLAIPDLSYLYYPAFIESKNLNYLTKFVPPSIRKASAVITISENTKNDIIKHFGVEPKKIFVTHLAADKVFVPQTNEVINAARKKYGINKPYLLFVGTFEPRKNIETLLRAFAGLTLIRKQYQLVLVGSKGWYADGIFRLINKLYLHDDVKILGYVPNSDLPAIYAGSELFVFPSFYEGFGLPVCEAMACGVPVLCSSASSLPEIGDRAGVYFNPFDTEELAGKTSDLLLDTEKRKQMRELGLAQASKFSWHKTAKETLEVFKKVWSGEI